MPPAISPIMNALAQQPIYNPTTGEEMPQGWQPGYQPQAPQQAQAGPRIFNGQRELDGMEGLRALNPGQFREDTRPNPMVEQVAYTPPRQYQAGEAIPQGMGRQYVQGEAIPQGMMLSPNADGGQPFLVQQNPNQLGNRDPFNILGGNNSAQNMLLTALGGHPGSSMPTLSQARQRGIDPAMYSGMINSYLQSPEGPSQTTARLGQLGIQQDMAYGTPGVRGSIANASQNVDNQRREGDQRYGPQAQYGAFYQTMMQQLVQGGMSTGDAVIELRRQGYGDPQFLHPGRTNNTGTPAPLVPGERGFNQPAQGAQNGPPAPTEPGFNPPQEGSAPVPRTAAAVAANAYRNALSQLGTPGAAAGAPRSIPAGDAAFPLIAEYLNQIPDEVLRGPNRQDVINHAIQTFTGDRFNRFVNQNMYPVPAGVPIFGMPESQRRAIQRVLPQGHQMSGVSGVVPNVVAAPGRAVQLINNLFGRMESDMR